MTDVEAAARPVDAGHRSQSADRAFEPTLALDVRGISKRFKLTQAAKKSGKLSSGPETKEFWALKDVSFSLRRGERLEIIGHNGAGKSTLLKVLSRVLLPTSGEADIYGRIASLLEVGTGFNPNLTGAQNIYLNAALHGLTRQEIAQRFDDIVAFSEIGKFIDEPVKRYSSGMKSRLGFAVAAHLDPDILMLDEVLSVGDAGFQQKCLERMEDLTGQGRTLLFVSHGMESVARFCNRCIWLDGGSIRAEGAVNTVVSAYIDATGTATSKISRRSTRQTDDTEAASDAAVGEASLISASIVNEHQQFKSVLSIHEKIGVVLEFDVHKAANYVPAIALYGPDNQLIFWSVPKGRLLQEHALDKGGHRAVVWLPANILNTGRYSVTVAVVGPDHAPMMRYVFEERALSFHTVEPPFDVESARGTLTRNFPGSLRPMLHWSIGPANESKLK